MTPQLLTAVFSAIDYESLQNATTRRIPLAEILSDDKELLRDILTKGTSNLITVEFENGLLLDIDVPRKYVLPDLSEHVYIKLTQNELHIIND